MLDSAKRKKRFYEILVSINKETQLSNDYDNFGENLSLAFCKFLGELENYDLKFETCVELVDLILFAENDNRPTITRLREKYEGYSDFMLGNYMKLGKAPDDTLMQKLAKFDLGNGFAVDQLVTSGWFYFREWHPTCDFNEVIEKSNKVWDIIFKVGVIT